MQHLWPGVNDVLFLAYFDPVKVFLVIMRKASSVYIVIMVLY